MSEWYVINKKTNEIVNCVVVVGNIPPSYLYDDNYLVTTTPSLRQLENYKYYNERS